MATNTMRISEEQMFKWPAEMYRAKAALYQNAIGSHQYVAANKALADLCELAAKHAEDGNWGGFIQCERRAVPLLKHFELMVVLEAARLRGLK
jgi:hypothetical protein